MFDQEAERSPEQIDRDGRVLEPAHVAGCERARQHVVQRCLLDCALAIVLDQVTGFDYVTVQAQVAPPVLTVPVIRIPAPDLTVYDALRAGAAA